MGKIPTRQVTPGEIQRLMSENPREAHDANLFIAILLLKLGGGATISMEEFLGAEEAGLGARVEIIPERRGADAVIHFRVRP